MFGRCTDVPEEEAVDRWGSLVNLHSNERPLIRARPGTGGGRGRERHRESQQDEESSPDREQVFNDAISLPPMVTNPPHA
jgi:hypothetical protein